MEGEVLIKVEGVSKKFCKNLKRSLWYGTTDMVAEIFGVSSSRKLRKKEFWAVSNVSFELKRGECLGLIGHNGAGKSTLLKMLNGLIKPDKGVIKLKGRIGALIELGAGFNPLLTGRENIYVNGQILGFSKSEINRKIDAIHEFSEIGDFIDAPVQNYSSGMKVRLGFAIAAQMEPDVLIIDEVLAVGDVGFRIKCLNRISELINRSAVIFVSHSMPQVVRVSTDILLMERGKSLFQSKDVNKGIDKYYQGFGDEELRIAGTNAKLLSFSFVKKLDDDPSANKTNLVNIKSNEGVQMVVKILPIVNMKCYSLNVVLVDQDLKPVAVYDSDAIDSRTFDKHIELLIDLPSLPLAKGRYNTVINFRGHNYTNEKEKVELLVRMDGVGIINVTHSRVFGSAPVILTGKTVHNKKVCD